MPAVGLNALQQASSLADEAPSVQERRDELVEALRDLEGRIVVFVDDLDRVTDDEIQEIVRLVKLVGDLPRITYVLAFDRDRVEQALGASETDDERARERGRAYLEKIVQSRHDVPTLRVGTAVHFTVEQINAALEPYALENIHETDWQNMLGLALRHMTTTPRDAKRIANSLPAAIEIHGDEVALVDLLGLEALRVLEPDVHAALPRIADVLVEDRLVIGGDEQQRRTQDRERVQAALERARHPDETRALLGQLFPKANQALGGAGRAHQTDRQERREKRVGQAPVLRVYLHAALDDDALAAGQVERLASLINRPEELRHELSELSDNQLADVIDRLLDYTDQFHPNEAVAVAQVVLELEPRLATGESPFLTGKAPPTWQLKWLVKRLIKTEPDRPRQTEMVRELFDDAPTLSTRLTIVQLFGTHPERDSKDRDPETELIDAATTTKLFDEIRRLVGAADTAELVGEHKTLELTAALLHLDAEAGRTTIREKAEDDILMLELLRECYTERSAQTLGEAAVRRMPYVNWKSLVALLGEETLKRRIGELEASVDPTALDSDTAAALEIATKIARGELDETNELL
ncbi:MAG: hypothetical protein H0U00_12745 [Actinobacteria bacterium]|nr:hypothetical protein [Actinomycetota bacterium]